MDGNEVSAEFGQTILEVARVNKVRIPTLCHNDALEPAAMCRLCTVEVDEGYGLRLVTACNYPIRRDAQIITDSKKVRAGRKIIIELLYARCEGSVLLQELGREYGADLKRFSSNDKQCIMCGLCARVCERVGGKTLTLAGRGVEIKVAIPFEYASEHCIACGACAHICPVQSIKIEDQGNERCIIMQGKEASRTKLTKCMICGKYISPIVDLRELTNLAGQSSVPPPNQGICSICSRRNLATRIAERYFEQYELYNGS